VSELHKDNLARWRAERKKAGKKSSAGNNSLSYRDRAKERRQKYGDDDPATNATGAKLKERYLAAREADTSAATSSSSGAAAIDSSNVGNRMLQKMGWREGRGLGKDGQGRTAIIEVTFTRLLLLPFLSSSSEIGRV